MTINKKGLLEQIKADILENNICPNLAKQAKNLVMGDGNIDADIVFIGEAPGKNEDEAGLPFVGAAGKFLDEMLATAGINRSDVYITNIVKYRPPNNRDPQPDEKKAFWPFLVRQLDVIKPKIVVTLGRHSMEYFLTAKTFPEKFRRLNQPKIGDIHGQPVQIELSDRQITIVPLYHPAAALYNGSMRNTLVEDFKKLPAILNKVEEKN